MKLSVTQYTLKLRRKGMVSDREPQESRQMERPRHRERLFICKVIIG